MAGLGSWRILARHVRCVRRNSQKERFSLGQKVLQSVEAAVRSVGYKYKGEVGSVAYALIRMTSVEWNPRYWTGRSPFLDITTLLYH